MIIQYKNIPCIVLNKYKFYVDPTDYFANINIIDCSLYETMVENQTKYLILDSKSGQYIDYFTQNNWGKLLLVDLEYLHPVSLKIGYFKLGYAVKFYCLEKLDLKRDKVEDYATTTIIGAKTTSPFNYSPPTWNKPSLDFFHREDGPAVVFNENNQQQENLYYLENIRYSKEGYKKALEKYKEKYK